MICKMYPLNSLHFTLAKKSLKLFRKVNNLTPFHPMNMEYTSTSAFIACTYAQFTHFDKHFIIKSLI